ncbi:hypothetical protein Q0M94_28420 (plasmid) [Deinococcus radiomollis]|uniref:hypothetical protein n=1 Tax=Deinococcus radiomollis TaxID=468916 RepID=UPI003891AAB5
MTTLQPGDRVRILASTFVANKFSRALIGEVGVVQGVQLDNRHLVTVSGWMYHRSDLEPVPAEAQA